MKNNIITIIALTCCILIILSMLGCKTTSETSEAVSTDIAATTEAVSKDAAAKEDKPIKISAWMYSDQAPNYLQYDGLKGQEFSKTNNIEVEYLAVSSAYTDIVPKLTSLIEAKDGSVAVLDFPLALTPWLAKSGLLLPLDDLVPKEYSDEIVLWEPLAYNGNHWVVNWVNDTSLLVYRKDLYAAAGLDPEKPPTSYDELYETAKALTKKDDAGNTLVGGMGWWGHTGQFYSEMIFGFGGEYIDENGNAVYNSPEGVKAYDYLKKLYDEGLVLKDLGETNIHNAFIDGSLAQCIQYGYFTNYANQQWGKQNVGFAMYPSSLDKKVTWSGHVYAINAFASPEAQQAALKWILYYNSIDYHTWLGTSSAYPIGSPIKSLLENPDMQAAHPDWKVIYETEKNRQTVPTPPDDFIPEMKNALLSIINGEKTTQEALDDAVAATKSNPDFATISKGVDEIFK